MTKYADEIWSERDTDQTAIIERLVAALERINERTSPDPSRTFSDALDDLDWVAAEARLALSKAKYAKPGCFLCSESVCDECAPR